MNEKLNVNLINQYLAENNLTKTEFCKRCNISTSTLSRIMKGKDFNLITLLRIAKTMHTKLHLLFTFN